MSAGQAWTAALGPSVLLGLVLAHFGGLTIVLHRRVTAWALARAEPALDRGDPGIASKVHLVGLLADLARSAVLVAIGLLAAALLKHGPHLDVATQRALAIVVVAGGFVAVIGGALRRAGNRAADRLAGRRHGDRRAGSRAPMIGHASHPAPPRGAAGVVDVRADAGHRHRLRDGAPARPAR